MSIGTYGTDLNSFTCFLLACEISAGLDSSWASAMSGAVVLGVDVGCGSGFGGDIDVVVRGGGGGGSGGCGDVGSAGVVRGCGSDGSGFCGVVVDDGDWIGFSCSSGSCVLSGFSLYVGWRILLAVDDMCLWISLLTNVFG